MYEKEILDRLEKEDEYWNGPRFIALLFITLGIALLIIYVIASIKSGDFSWPFLAHDVKKELPISSW
ncbi:MAG: hypothetical protein RMJ84_07150 [Sandaracinaceae bacterium]|nr:hypothetical protein [Sandaracinaceae bacterium]